MFENKTISKQTKRFFTDLVGVEFQSVKDDSIFKRQLKTYGLSKKFKEFEAYLKTVGEQNFLEEKNRVLFDTIKSFMLRLDFQVFNMLNVQKLMKGSAFATMDGAELYFRMLAAGVYSNFKELVAKDDHLFDLFANYAGHFNNFNFGDRKVDDKVNKMRVFLIKETNFEDYISSNFKFKEFILENEEALMAIKISKKDDIPGCKTIYNDKFDGNILISLDLKKANFQVLRSLSMVVDTTYDSLISRFSSMEYIADNKQFRQVLFGNLARKRIQKFQECIMRYVHGLYADINLEGIHILKKLENIYVPTSDEMIFQFPISKRNFSGSYGTLQGTFFRHICDRNDVIEKNNFEFRRDLFKLEKVNTNKGSFYVKRFFNIRGYDAEDANFEIKGCHSKFYYQLYRLLKGKRLYTKDLVFEDKETKTMCRFLKSDKLKLV